MSSMVFSCVALAVTAACAVTDSRSGRIPNVLTLPALGVGLGLHAVSGSFALAHSVLGVLACAAVPVLLRRATDGRAIGGGDVKLFAALGALLGPTLGVEVELSSFVLSAALALLHLTFVGRLGAVLSGALFLLVNPCLPRRLRRQSAKESFTEVRLGPAIFAAVAAVIVADQAAQWVPWRS